MLTELYIEALLADEAVADAIWALWDAGVITDDTAAWAWWLVASQNALRGDGSVLERTKTDSPLDD